MTTIICFLAASFTAVIDEDNHQTVSEKILPKPTMRQIQEIKSLINQLELKSEAAEKSCYAAADRLQEFKRLAFPQLMDHFDDERKSGDFFHRAVNIEPDHLVGDACAAIIYNQLTDTPSDYSVWGLTRVGKNGESHTKPRWNGSPFRSAGGLRKWLVENNKLTYNEMKIKCIQWFLDEERKIGVPDSDSYFLNILPLEIRIFELRFDDGDNVSEELQKLRNRHSERKDEDVPKHLLPAN